MNQEANKKEKKVAILQPNYIPWKGYFDLINSVDEFIIYDDVQYTRRDWRNRNLIKTNKELRWLTIPVEVKGKYKQTIKETRVANNIWAEKHWKTIKQYYRSAPYFRKYENLFECAYIQCSEIEFLSEINKLFINLINSILAIETVLSTSSDYKVEGDKNEKIISLCKQIGADTYVTGPSARDYLDQTMFDKEGITIQWANYTGYPEYNQKFSPFEHNVSIIDLIFSVGDNAPLYMKSF
jgi:hypothetical protein